MKRLLQSLFWVMIFWVSTAQAGANFDGLSRNVLIAEPVLSSNGPNSAWGKTENGGADEVGSPVVHDPVEAWNRIWFTFNDLFYFGVLKPISVVYGFLTPEMLRVGISNTFHNLAMPKHFASALLQGKPGQAGIELSRFGLNTLFGGLGFVDVAGQFDLKSTSEDMGQALGVYGFGDGFYLVWPVVGPSNFRDTVGLAGDTILNPLSYYPEDFWARAGIFAFETVNYTSLRIGEYEELKEAAIDPYLSLRDAYLQRRRKQISY